MFEKIRDIIVEQLDLDDSDSLTMETSLKDDLDADSLDAVEVIMARSTIIHKRDVSDIPFSFKPIFQVYST